MNCRRKGVHSTPSAKVDAQELLDAFDFVSAGYPGDNEAYICIETGHIFCNSIAAGLKDEDFPDDAEDSDRYIAVPHKHEFNLGRHLALAFAEQEIPDDYDVVASFFQRRGAYGRFKDLLYARSKLERWYAYEAEATSAALRQWCEENDLPMVGRAPDGDSTNGPDC